MRSARVNLTCLVFLTVACTFRVLSQSADTLTILHTSDIHTLFGIDEYAPVIADFHRVSSTKVDSLAKFFASTPRQLHADAVVITGDLVDIYEGESKTGRMLSTQIEQFRALCDECPVPLYMTLGNHDITSYRADDAHKDIVQSQTVAGRARASWIRNIPCFFNGTYYAKTFPVGRTKYHFIFLDNGYSLHDGGRVLDKQQCDWLKDQVAAAGHDPIILFFHIYFGVGDINGDGVAFKENGPLDWPTAKECSEGLLKIVNENKNIKAMVVGHGHSNIVEGIRFPAGQTVYQVETGSVTEESSNWRLFQFTEDGIIVTKSGTRMPEVKIPLRSEGR